MIKIKYKTKKNTTPHYVLRYNYMIGDSCGYTTEELTISLNNPYIEKYITLLNSLKPLKGHWGIILESDRLLSHLEEGHINAEEYEFLYKVMFGAEESDEEDEYLGDFWEGVKGDTEYRFLVFEGVDLFYCDEYGIRHGAEIVNV